MRGMQGESVFLIGADLYGKRTTLKTKVLAEWLSRCRGAVVPNYAE